MNAPAEVLERAEEMTDEQILEVCVAEGFTDAEAAVILDEARGRGQRVDGLPTLLD